MIPLRSASLRSVGGALFAQAMLHGQLAQIEWTEEKNLLLKMLVVGVAGFSCLLCLMLFAGALVVVLSWNTGYFIPAIIAMIVVYGLGASLAWRRFQILSLQSNQAFAATREELTEDIALFKGRL